LLIFTQKRKALAWKLLEDFVFLLHEEQKFAQAAVLDEFTLDFNTIEKHWGQSYDDHLLIYLVNLRQGL
jgi:hypothetical protein